MTLYRRMSELRPALQTVPLFALTLDGKPVLIDGLKNSTGYDIVLLFSDMVRAQSYANSYPDLRDAKPHRITIAELIEHFQGRVEYYTLDANQRRAPAEREKATA